MSAYSERLSINKMEENKEMQRAEWINEASEKIKQKMCVVAKRSQGKIPYTTINGIFDDKS